MEEATKVSEFTPDELAKLEDRNVGLEAMWDFGSQSDFPAQLKPPVNYTQMPRRYEQTRPVLLQKWVHGSVLKIGHDFHAQLLREAEEKEEQAVQSAIATTQEWCRHEKTIALDKLKSSAQANREEAVTNLKQEYEKKIKEQRVELIAELNAKAQADLESANKEAEEQLIEAVEKVKRETMKYIKKQVDKVRVVEQKAGEKQVEAVEREIQEILEEERQKASLDQDASLTQLRELLQAEVQTASEDSRLKGKEMSSHHLATVITNQAQKMTEYEKQINELKNLIDSKEEAILDADKRRKAVLVDLNTARLQVQHLVCEKLNSDQIDQSDFIVNLRGNLNFEPDITEFNEGTDY